MVQKVPSQKYHPWFLLLDFQGTSPPSLATIHFDSFYFSLLECMGWTRSPSLLNEELQAQHKSKETQPSFGRSGESRGLSAVFKYRSSQHERVWGSYLWCVEIELATR